MGPEVRTKKVYIFSSTNSKCFDEGAIAHKVAYLEEWTNEAPDHPAVWALPGDKRTEMEALEAMQTGCALENLERSRMTFDQYVNHPKQNYPAFTSNK